jgi:hypothetical protein
MYLHKNGRGRAGWLAVSLLAAAFTVAACGGVAPPEAPAAQPETVEAATAAPVPTSTQPTQSAPTATSAAAEAPAQAEPVSSGPAVCEAVDIPDNTLIAAVSETDWAKGPASAPVTLIEYGDFQ